MKDANEKEASDEPGNMTERTLMEEWAARREVEVRYSPTCIGANVICSAREMTVETVLERTGEVTVVPPKRAWSTTVDVTDAMEDAMR